MAFRLCRACVLIDKAGIHVGVNRQLFSGHGIQSKAGRYLGHTPGATVDDCKLNDHQDQEDHHTHDIIPAHDEVAEGGDDLTGFAIQ